MEFVEIEVWAVVDETGDYATGNTQDEATSRYRETISSDMDIAMRHIKMSIKVPKPKPIEVSFMLPDESGEIAVATA